VTNSFCGFAADSFDFFQDLAENNNKMWFDENRPRYEQHVTGAFRGLLESLSPFLVRLDPHFETTGKTNGNFSRINRDIRFSKDKRPYKSNFYLYVYDGRRDRGDGGRLYVGLSGECLTVGFSIYAGDRRDAQGALKTIFRKRFVSHRELFDRLLEKVVRALHYETYWHRLEKGDWSQHSGLPRRDEDWTTLQAWIVRKVFLPGSRSVASPSFAKQVENIFSELFPLYLFTSVNHPQWESQLKKCLGPSRRPAPRKPKPDK
jgi:uncharacterized protein (TIGR02453 family)